MSPFPAVSQETLPASQPASCVLPSPAAPLSTIRLAISGHRSPNSTVTLIPFYLAMYPLPQGGNHKAKLRQICSDCLGRLALKHHSLAHCQKQSFLTDVFCQDQCQDDYYHSNLRVSEELHITFSLTTDACCYLCTAAGIVR